jgi:hypothetical protein
MWAGDLRRATAAAAEKEVAMAAMLENWKFSVIGSRFY